MSKQKSSFSALFWDNDGVLVDTETLYFRANREVLAGLGLELDMARFREWFLENNCGPWDAVAELGHDPEAIITHRESRNARYSELLRTEPIEIAGAAGVLARLENHLRMAVVTSSRKDHFALIHARTGFLSHFEFVIAAGDYEKSKPAADPYQAALQRSELLAEDCLVIEDSARGLQAAKSAGLACWVIPTELSVDSDFSAADKVLESIEQVPELFGI